MRASTSMLVVVRTERADIFVPKGVPPVYRDTGSPVAHPQDVFPSCLSPVLQCDLLQSLDRLCSALVEPIRARLVRLLWGYVAKRVQQVVSIVGIGLSHIQRGVVQHHEFHRRCQSLRLRRDIVVSNSGHRQSQGNRYSEDRVPGLLRVPPTRLPYSRSLQCRHGRR